MSTINHHLSDIEKDVIRALVHVGWYRNLWFPSVQRDPLNYPDGSTDAEIQSALLDLVRRAVIEVGVVRCGVFKVAAVVPDAVKDIKYNKDSEYELRVPLDVEQIIRGPRE